MKKAKILDERVAVRADMDPRAPVVMDVDAGDEVDLGKVRERDGQPWVKVRLRDGSSGYLPGDTKVMVMKETALLQEEVEVHASPTMQSPLQRRFKKGERFYLLDVVKNDAEEWVRVRDFSGEEGFIPGETRIRVIENKTHIRGAVHMFIGAMACTLGIIGTGIPFSGTTGHGGIQVIAWGAAVFGALQFLLGFYQVLTGR